MFERHKLDLEALNIPPPPLPSLSSDILATAFVHSSTTESASSTDRFEYVTEVGIDNERLELLGDALLYQVVAHWLYTRYPKLKVHYLTAIRQRLVQNETLAMFARLYNMEEALRLPRDLEYLRSQVKIQADTFESYIGALYLQKGQQAATDWLIKLMLPYAEELYRFYRIQADKMGPKATLYGWVASARSEPAESTVLLPKTGQSDDRVKPQGTSFWSFLCPCLPPSRTPTQDGYAPIGTTEQPIQQEPVRQPQPLVPASVVKQKQVKMQAAKLPSKSPRLGYNSLSESDGEGIKHKPKVKARVDQPKSDVNSTPTSSKHLMPKNLAATTPKSSVDKAETPTRAKASDGPTKTLVDPRNPITSADDAVATLNARLAGRKLTWEEIPQSDGTARIAAVLAGKRIASGAGPDLRTALERAVLNAIDALPNNSSPLRQAQNLPATPKASAQIAASDKKLVVKRGVAFPGAVFDSLPTQAPNEKQVYYILTAGGADCQNWYYAIFNSNRELLAHAMAKTRTEAIEAAEKQLGGNESVPKINFSFNTKPSIDPHAPSNPSGPPGSATKLLHAFRQDGPARLLWLYWQSMDSGVWKDVCFIDGVYRASGKNTEARLARSESSLRAIETLK